MRREGLFGGDVEGVDCGAVDGAEVSFRVVVADECGVLVVLFDEGGRV